MINYILLFIFGAMTGILIVVFMINSGTVNKQYDAYQEGFICGYKKGKEEWYSQQQDTEQKD